MKTFIELDENDIRKIVAKYYDIPEDKISIYTKTYYEGYGPTERLKHGVFLRIVKEDSP